MQRNIAIRAPVSPGAALAAIAREDSARAVIDNLTLIVFRIDAERRFGFINEYAAVAFGIPVSRVDGRQIHDTGWPPQVCDQLADACSICFAAGREMELEYQCHDRWHHMRLAPERDADGTIVSVAGMILDVTDRHEHLVRNEMLVRELSHRIKNTLSTVQSIAALMRYENGTPEAAFATFEARLAALGEAHSLLSDGQWQSVPLKEVLTSALRPFGRAYALAGPTVVLKPQAVLTLSMIFHELATNAAKYGAFSAQGGRVVVAWTVMTDDCSTERVLSLVWYETGGPPVAPPKRRGFGRLLIERGIGFDLRGSAQMAFAVEGFCCNLRLPSREALS